MAGVMLPDMRPWGRRALTIPPDSRNAWIHLAIWELWMGILIAMIVGFGAIFLTTAPHRLITIVDLEKCYGPPPVMLPCERIVYRGGLLDAAFTALCGVTLIAAGAWLMWELWKAVEPKPITDDFLRLLNDSFGRNWRDPRTWPWRRVLFAYGFAAVGASLTIGVALIIWTAAAASWPVRARAVHVDTSQTFTLGR